MRLRGNELAYPCGVAPGFDPTHIAAGTPRFSGISASGGGFTNLLNGAPGTKAGTPTSIMDGGTGPATSFPSAGDAVNFSGQSTVNDAVATIGTIFRGATFNNSVLFTTSNDAGFASGLFTSINGAGNPGISALGGSGTTVSSLLVAVVDVPYFYAVSMSSGATNFILKRLDTGQVVQETGAGVTLGSAPNGTYGVGGYSTQSVAFKGSVAALMFSAKYLSPQALLSWSGDPWDYWYPQRDR